MDRITLRGIRAHGRHGAYDGEREAEQPFDLDVLLDMDLRDAQTSDELGDTIDYDALHQRLIAIVASTSFALLERLASELLEAIFTDTRVARAEVSIAKPGKLEGATPSITLVRENPRYRGTSA
jgi:dihydroneopterin aldolase